MLRHRGFEIKLFEILLFDVTGYSQSFDAKTASRSLDLHFIKYMRQKLVKFTPGRPCELGSLRQSKNAYSFKTRKTEFEDNMPLPKQYKRNNLPFDQFGQFSFLMLLLFMLLRYTKADLLHPIYVYNVKKCLISGLSISIQFVSSANMACLNECKQIRKPEPLTEAKGKAWRFSTSEIKIMIL